MNNNEEDQNFSINEILSRLQRAHTNASLLIPNPNRKVFISETPSIISKSTNTQNTPYGNHTPPEKLTSPCAEKLLCNPRQVSDVPKELKVSKMNIYTQRQQFEAAVEMDKPDKLSKSNTNKSNELTTGDKSNGIITGVVQDLAYCLERLDSLRNPIVARAMVKAVLKDKFKNNMELKNKDSLLALGDYMGDINPSANGHDDSRRNTLVDPQHKRASLQVLCKKLASYWSIADINNLLQIVDNLHTWGVDIFKLRICSSNRPLTTLSYVILKDRNIDTKFTIPSRTLINNFMKLEDTYRSFLPYHNSSHAADVLVSTHYLLSFEPFRHIFTELEIFAALFACIIHDIDHPGYTNLYLMKTGSQLANLYNNSSILENHHLAVAFKVLDEETFNILQVFSRRERRVFRDMVTGIVIATDPAYHLKLYLEIKALVQLKSLDAGQLYLDNEHRLHLLQILVHGADISNPVKPLDQYKKWVEGIMKEFFNQGDKERKKNLEISPLCDRHTVDIAKCQVGFIDFVVQPFWEQMGAFVGEDMDGCLKQLNDNRQYFSNNRFHITTPNSETNEEEEEIRFYDTFANASQSTESSAVSKL